ncbi:hypothetical protein Sjap_020774 [Stephania japonica]|uniref:AB hydrolase-1 domain-containing protein n=1 Tax=Stephania japonica TaxID=461633 RepID=A0AAP0F406_9MAGN
MVNLVAAQKSLAHWLMKQAGVVPHTVEIEQGTVMNFWVPTETVKTQSKDKASNIINNGGHNEGIKSKSKSAAKPVVDLVVLIHGFAAEGIVTWQFQVGSLTNKYSVYVPDLLFFGGSTSSRTDRSKAFQEECVAKGLWKLGVKRCTVVGFSYGGMVAFEMAEKYPELVDAFVVSGSSIYNAVHTNLYNIGFNSLSEFLLPTSVEGVNKLFKVATYKNIWFPYRVYRDFLKVMFNNREEKAEFLDELEKQKGCTKHKFQQIHLLWGENDKIFLLDVAQRMKKRQLGEKVTLHGIKKAGHLVHVERPCAYNRCLKEFLATLTTED